MRRLLCCGRRLAGFRRFILGVGARSVRRIKIFIHVVFQIAFLNASLRLERKRKFSRIQGKSTFRRKEKEKRFDIGNRRRGVYALCGDMSYRLRNNLIKNDENPTSSRVFQCFLQRLVCSVVHIENAKIKNRGDFIFNIGD